MIKVRYMYLKVETDLHFAGLKLDLIFQVHVIWKLHFKIMTRNEKLTPPANSSSN